MPSAIKMDELVPFEISPAVAILGITFCTAGFLATSSLIFACSSAVIMYFVGSIFPSSRKPCLKIVKCPNPSPNTAPSRIPSKIRAM